MTKKFVLVSLNEKKAKKIAEVISNNTSRKILDFLSGRKDATASQIHKELKIPLPTVDYNLKALMAAKLVKSDEYHYSEKGKEVSHYKIANQYVIIAPAEEKASIREKLKSILPVAGIAGVSASMIKLVYDWFGGSVRTVAMNSAPMMAKVATDSADAAVGGAAPAMYEAAPEVARSAGEALSQAAPSASPALADDAVSEFANHTIDEGARMATHESTKALAEPLTHQIPPPEPQTFTHFLATHIPDLIIFFLIGAALGIGGYYLFRYFKNKHRRVEIEV